MISFSRKSVYSVTRRACNDIQARYSGYKRFRSKTSHFCATQGCTYPTEIMVLARGQGSHIAHTRRVRERNMNIMIDSQTADGSVPLHAHASISIRHSAYAAHHMAHHTTLHATPQDRCSDVLTLSQPTPHATAQVMTLSASRATPPHAPYHSDPSTGRRRFPSRARIHHTAQPPRTRARTSVLLRTRA